MKIEISRLGTIFGCALYDELEDALREFVHVDDDGFEIVYHDDVLKAIKTVLGVED